MTVNDTKPGELQRHLDDARAHAEAGNYAEALACLKDARGVQPENVYVLAFEKQIEQLLEMVQKETLTDEHKSDILESIPHIIDRALATVEGRKDAVPAGPPPAAAGQPAGAGRDDRAAALEWLKNQYFQHAHEYVQRGEYQHALTEIRRVFIIDPDNPTARQLERQILDLSQMRAEEEEEKARRPAGILSSDDDATPLEDDAPAAGAGTVDDRAGGQGSSEKLDVAVPQITGPEPLIVGRPAVAQAKRKTPAKKGLGRPGMVAIFASIIAIGIAIFFFGIRPAARQDVASKLPTLRHAPEVLYDDQPVASEQTFIISDRGNPDGSASLELLPDTTPAETVEPIPAGPPPTTQPLTSPADRASSSRTGQATSGTVDRPTSSPAAERETQGSGIQTPSLTGAARPAVRTGDPGSAPAGGAPSRTVEFVPVEAEAKIVKLETPRLQEAVYAEGLEGQVVIQVKIDETGKPVETRILKSTNERLNIPVIDAVMRSTYSSARMTAGPVSSWLTIPFTLRKASR